MQIKLLYGLPEADLSSIMLTKVIKEIQQFTHVQLESPSSLFIPL